MKILRDVKMNFRNDIPVKINVMKWILLFCLFYFISDAQMNLLSTSIMNIILSKRMNKEKLKRHFFSCSDMFQLHCIQAPWNRFPWHFLEHKKKGKKYQKKTNKNDMIFHTPNKKIYLKIVCWNFTFLTFI